MLITKELFKRKTLSDGSHPVIIRIYHNGVIRRVNTSVYTKDRFWNSAKGCICSRDKDHKIKNEMIDAIYRRVSGKIQNFIDQILDLELDSLISSEKFSKFEPIVHKSCFLDLIDKKIEATLSYNTRKGYEGFRRYFSEKFGKGPEVGSIDQKFTNRYISQLNRDYSFDSPMKQLMISRYNAVINYANECGLRPTPEKLYLPKYNISCGDRNLNLIEVRQIADVFTSTFHSDPKVTQPTTFALGIFLLDIAFQGLAPVDLASLHIGSLKYRVISGPGGEKMQVVYINTRRKKTGRTVTIVSALVGIGRFLEVIIEGKADDDYFLPCFRPNLNYSESQRQNRLANYFNKHAKLLNNAMNRYYQQNNLGTPPHITFYFARHAFCNLMNELDMPRHIIQYLIGHKSTVLERSYLRPISPWEQAKASERLLMQIFT